MSFPNLIIISSLLYCKAFSTNCLMEKIKSVVSGPGLNLHWLSSSVPLTILFDLISIIISYILSATGSNDIPLSLEVTNLWVVVVVHQHPYIYFNSALILFVPQFCHSSVTEFHTEAFSTTLLSILWVSPFRNPILFLPCLYKLCICQQEISICIFRTFNLKLFCLGFFNILYKSLGFFFHFLIPAINVLLQLSSLQHFSVLYISYSYNYFHQLCMISILSFYIYSFLLYNISLLFIYRIILIRSFI